MLGKGGVTLELWNVTVKLCLVTAHSHFRKRSTHSALQNSYRQVNRKDARFQQLFSATAPVTRVISLCVQTIPQPGITKVLAYSLGQARLTEHLTLLRPSAFR
jgi:hypothetical protein